MTPKRKPRPGPRPKPPQNFRAVLVEQIKRTRFARESTTLEETAERLGVRADVLAQARQEYRQKAFRADYERYRFFVSAPKIVRDHWNRVAAARKIEGPLLLRGLIQALLLSGQPPTTTHTFWFYRGVAMPIPSGIKSKWPWRIEASISRGADKALDDIANRLGCSKTALVRGQVVDFLEGRTKRVVLISSSQMYNDPRKYLEKWKMTPVE